MNASRRRTRSLLTALVPAAFGSARIRAVAIVLSGVALVLAISGYAGYRTEIDRWTSGGATSAALRAGMSEPSR